MGPVRRWLGAAFGILAIVVFIISCGLFWLSEAISGPEHPQPIEVRPGVWRIPW